MRHLLSVSRSHAAPRAAAALAAVLLAGSLLTSACARPKPAPPTPTPPPGDAGPSSPPAPPTWIDASASPFAVRGVIEGFYGTPWTQEKRLEAFGFMARVGMNTYVYAPKDDPYQRAQWRELYPETELARFRALLERAAKDRVNFVYSISPGLDIIYSGLADRQALDDKLDQLASLGIHTIMLSLDDVPEKLKPADTVIFKDDYALAQAELANWLYTTRRAKDSAFVLWLTPSHYYGTKADPYLTTLGSRLHADIPIVWTGPMVVSGHITNEQADAFAGIIKRKPLIWDNYPVNDYTYAIDKKPRLILGPLRNRDAGLADHVSGYLLNPMIQESASQMPLYTAAAYLASPTSYNPDAAWKEAAVRFSGISVAAAVLEEFASYAQRSAVQPKEAPLLAAALQAYGKTGTGGSGGANLRARFDSMVSLPTRLAAAAPPGFYGEVKPWVDALHDKGQAGLLALEVEDARVRGDTATVQSQLPRLQQALTALKEQQAKAMIAGNLVEDFVAQVIDRAQVAVK
ncbi:MAG: protein O-GlcNAcase [Bacillota bacterium]